MRRVRTGGFCKQICFSIFYLFCGELWYMLGFLPCYLIYCSIVTIFIVATVVLYAYLIMIKVEQQ
jgi:hypothetical protein